MAFIPIDAKADLQGQKKGKLTPAQHAQLNAWCLASKTGILDCLEKCVADNENITVNSSDTEAVVVFKSGYFVVCGRLVECEAKSEVIIPMPTVNSIEGKIVARFDLTSSGDGEFKVLAKTKDFETVDLNDNPSNGRYDFVLYEYTANRTANTVTLKRTQPYIPDIGGKLAQFEASLKDEGKPLHGYDDTKGTIEDRLSRLGFNEVSTTYEFVMQAGTEENNTGTIKNEGRFAEIFIDFGVNNRSSYPNYYVLRFSGEANITGSTKRPDFIPKDFSFNGNINCVVYGQSQGGSGWSDIKFPCVITTSEDKITIKIIATAPDKTAYTITRINGKVVFSWSTNITLQ